jgi:hypothetical protein
MSHTPHELHEEIPAHSDRIHALKVSDPHFAKLAEEYHAVNRAVNRAVHRAETKIDPMDNLAETELRKTRAALKDRLYKMITA